MGSHAIGFVTGPWLRRLGLAVRHPLTSIQAERHDRVNAGSRQGTSPTYTTAGADVAAITAATTGLSTDAVGAASLGFGHWRKLSSTSCAAIDQAQRSTERGRAGGRTSFGDTCAAFHIDIRYRKTI
jgi:hypothetical protein